MINAATFNAYLDVLGISHKAAAAELAVDRQTMKRWCTGNLDVPRGVENWILRRLEEHDRAVDEICLRARMAVDSRDVAFIAYDRYSDPRGGDGDDLSEAIKQRGREMAALSAAIGRLRAEGYSVVCDYTTDSEGRRVDAAWLQDEPAPGTCLAQNCPHAVYDGNYRWKCTYNGDDVDPYTLACHVGLRDDEDEPGRYDDYVLDEDGVYIGDDNLIKAVLDGEIDRPEWLPLEDIEEYKRGVRKNMGAK